MKRELNQLAGAIKSVGKDNSIKVSLESQRYHCNPQIVLIDNSPTFVHLGRNYNKVQDFEEDNELWNDVKGDVEGTPSDVRDLFSIVFRQSTLVTLPSPISGTDFIDIHKENFNSL